jgi:hypothetical protein
MNSPTFNAAWLMRQEFPPIKYAVPGVVPEGLTVLAASPKAGKSWLVLGLGLELACGGYAFGALHVGRARPVLYLALEDGQRRLQDRIRRLEPREVSHRLEFATAIPDGKVIEIIRGFMQRYDGLDPVVILDTLGKVMPPAGAQSQYGHDYQTLSALKRTCDEVPGSSLIVGHHTRKMDAGDFLDAVSGTQGIAGAADTVLVLKRDRHGNAATLQVTSRDAAEGEYSLTLTDRGAWELDGGDLAAAAQAAQATRSSQGTGERMTELIETVGRFPGGIRRKDLSELLHMEDNQLGTYLKRATEAGRIANPQRGLYTPVTSVTSVTFPIGESDAHDTYDTPLGVVA